MGFIWVPIYIQSNGHPWEDKHSSWYMKVYALLGDARTLLVLFFELLNITILSFLIEPTEVGQRRDQLSVSCHSNFWTHTLLYHLHRYVLWIWVNSWVWVNINAERCYNWEMRLMECLHFVHGLKKKNIKSNIHVPTC